VHDANLRLAVATIEGELAQLATYPTGAIPATSVPELRASWARLVELLALGPEPQVRNCPTCNHLVYLTAVRCRFCWNKLRPAAPNEA
jgi:hypothetical protein